MTIRVDDNRRQHSSHGPILDTQSPWLWRRRVRFKRANGLHEIFIKFLIQKLLDFVMNGLNQQVFFPFDCFKLQP